MSAAEKGGAGVGGGGGDPVSRWKRYVYDTGVLRNKLGITDPSVAAEVERVATTARLADLPRTPHTAEGYKAIHRHLFQDLYDWAGRTRTVDMHRRETLADGTERQDSYLPHRFIGRALDMTFEDLKPALASLRREAAKEPHERDAALVARVAAAHVGALNFVHAFRDGNGRTMRAQVDNLAQEAGLRLDEAALSKREWDRGSHEANADPNDTATLARAIAAALEPRERHQKRQQAAARGELPPAVAPHARDTPGPRAERPPAKPRRRHREADRDHGLGD